MSDEQRFPLGVWIKQHRARLGLTQPELAERVGAARPICSMIERGQFQPSVDLIERLADALQVSAADRAAWVQHVTAIDPDESSDHAAQADRSNRDQGKSRRDGSAAP